MVTIHISRLPLIFFPRQEVYLYEDGNLLGVDTIGSLRLFKGDDVHHIHGEMFLSKWNYIEFDPSTGRSVVASHGGPYTIRPVHPMSKLAYVGNEDVVILDTAISLILNTIPIESALSKSLHHLKYRIMIATETPYLPI